MRILTQDQKAFYQINNFYIKDVKRAFLGTYLMSNVYGVETALAAYSSNDVAEKVFSVLVQKSDSANLIKLPLEDEVEEWCGIYLRGIK